MNNVTCPMCGKKFDIPYRVMWTYRVESGFDIVDRDLIKREKRVTHTFCGYNCHSEYLKKYERYKNARKTKLKCISNKLLNFTENEVYDILDTKWYDEKNAFMFALKNDRGNVEYVNPKLFTIFKLI